MRAIQPGGRGGLPALAAAALLATGMMTGGALANSLPCSDPSFDSVNPEDDFAVYSTAPDDGSSVNPSAGTLYDATPQCEVIAVSAAQAGTSTGGGPGAADSESFVNWGNAFETTGTESDWVFVAKYQVAGGVEQQDGSISHPDGGDYFDHIVISGDQTGSLTSTSDGQSGYFLIDEQARVIYDEILILVKQKEWFYMALITDIPGLPEYIYYETPFRTGGGGAQDISHISFYGRTALNIGVGNVPVPPAAPLLAGALSALALLRRRRG